MMKLNPNAISGIHNYCDRWCERCHFTSRCNVFENNKNINPEEQDIRNKAFWDRLSRQFAETLAMITKAAADAGIDLNAIPDDKEKELEYEQMRLASEQHPLCTLSWDYSNTAIKWLQNNKSLRAKQDELIEHVTLGILPEDQAQTEVATMKDCLEIIEWYLHFIHVKFMRAVSGKLEDDGWEKENGFQNDFDGSAKIATIAVERTLQAWLALRPLVPLDEDTFLEMAGPLQKIKSLAEKEFPNAKTFIRPGFDDGMSSN